MALLKINRAPTKRDLLIFSFAWAIFATAIGGWWSYRLGNTLPIAIAVPLGIALPLSLAVTSRLATWVFLGLSFATYPIGFIVSHTVLAILYFGIMTPIGIVMRLRGHDPLKLGVREIDNLSHWQNRSGSRETNSYFKQY